MAHLGTVGTATASSTTNSLALTLTDDVPVGATILVSIAWDAPSPGGVPTIASVVDSSGNTWTTTPDVSIDSGETVAVAVVRALVETQLDDGDTITVTISGNARGRWAMQADAYDDIVDTSPLDETSANAGSASSLTTGQTGETSTPHTLLYAAFGFGGGRNVTIPMGWTGGPKVETAAGSGNRALQVIHRYVAATDEYEATLGLSSSSTYAAVLAAYAYTPPVPEDPVADIAQVKLEAPNPGVAPVAHISQVALDAPQGALGAVHVAQVALQTPAGEGQPYTGLKVARDGGWWNAGVHVLG
jgi:hypothetical protein